MEKQIRWTEADSEGLAKLMALDRFIGGDDDAFVDVIRETPDLKAALVGEPCEPEPEDDEETITYPDVWDHAGDKAILWLCAAGLALFWGAPIALSLWWAANR